MCNRHFASKWSFLQCNSRPFDVILLVFCTESFSTTSKPKRVCKFHSKRIIQEKNWLFHCCVHIGSQQQVPVCASPSTHTTHHVKIKTLPKRRKVFSHHPHLLSLHTLYIILPSRYRQHHSLHSIEHRSFLLQLLPMEAITGMSVALNNLLILCIWCAVYFTLATVMKVFSKTVMFHSIIHCFSASIFAGYALLRCTGGNLFTYDIYHVMLDIKDPEGIWWLHQAVLHSTGYFISDTIDIRIDHTNLKRQIFVWHHLAAICGMATMFFDSYLCLVGLWSLEIGGVVHHIKHAAHVFQFSYWPNLVAEVLYHTVYLSTRLFLLVNNTYGLYFITESKTIVLDVMCFTATYFLLYVNLLWWYQNAKKLFEPTKKE